MDKGQIIPFNKVYVISLKDRQDRLDIFFKNLPNPWVLGNIEIFQAIDGYGEKIPLYWKSGKGAWGCYQSHLKIIKQSIENNFDRIIILEDDAIFCPDFNDKAISFISNLPTDWEMFYLGGQHLKMPKPIVTNNIVGIGTNINRTHAYGLSKNGLNKIYKWLLIDDWKKGHHIDHHYGRLHETDGIVAYCPLYWLVGQNQGLSNISRKQTSTRWWNH